MYCANCNLLTTAFACPRCGSNDLRVPSSRDYCFLCKQDALWAEMLEDVLTQYRIPVVTRTGRSAAMVLRSNPLNQEVLFYVPYGWLERAKELEQSLFEAEVLEPEFLEEY